MLNLIIVVVPGMPFSNPRLPLTPVYAIGLFRWRVCHGYHRVKRVEPPFPIQFNPNLVNLRE